MRLLTIVAILLVYFCHTAYAQDKGLNNTGSVKGILRDSLYNRTLNSATISIYTRPDDKLLTFQVSNNLGEFIVKSLPLSQDLKMIISNIGYHSVSKNFNINAITKIIDFKTVFTNLATTQLKEVSITIPPMQMNGDTLEFNSAAFKLDSNAVVQDLMKRISNITLWGDGKITVNGREIKSVLVNGKKFMGGDPKISIENIPKNALDKIQVYNTVDNPRNLLDSSLNMNLKLKKGKDIGYFGKIGGGYGTGNKFEVDLNLNIFSPKLQLSIVGASNNINKIAANINTLQRNSTFKGVGVQVDYMSDFRTVGINQPNSAGYSFTYDFSDKVGKKDNLNIFNSEYFLHNNQIQRESNSQTTTAIAGSADIMEQAKNGGNENNTSQTFSSGYQFSKDRYEINFSQNIDIISNKSDNESQGISFGEGQQIVSRSKSLNKNESLNKSYGIKLDFNFGPRSIIGDSRFSGLGIAYSLDINDTNSDKENLTNFESVADPSKNQLYNRQYNNLSKGINQKINFDLPNIMNLIFGIGNFKLFEVDFKNDLKINHNNSNNRVYDYDKNINQLITNIYLTNNTTYNSLIYEPVFQFQKTFTKSLSNRFDKSWHFYFNLKSQLYYQKNKSEKDFQNINRLYDNLLPTAGINFSDSQYGEYRSNISISYENSATIPNIGQLAPLTDSTNVYFLRTINLNLKEEKSHSLTLSFKRSSEKKNNFDYKIIASYVKISDNIIDSTLIDAQNVRTIYHVNNSNNSSFNLSGNVNKAIKFKNSEVQFSYDSKFSHSENPNIVNNIEQELITDYFNNSLKINLTYKTNLAIEAKQNITNTFTKQSNKENDSFRNSHLSTSFSASYNLTKKLKINSNISLSTNMSTGLKNINYNIWNASTIYRLLKGNNLEVKFSALDLLHQNTSVININRAGKITLGTQNVLQQYFIFGISYYPRKFGKNVKK